MAKTLAAQIISPERIESRIFVLRGHRVMLDRDLAELYGVALKRLNEQVKRNRRAVSRRFYVPVDLGRGKGCGDFKVANCDPEARSEFEYRPYVYTEHGAIMLANVTQGPVASGQVFR